MPADIRKSGAGFDLPIAVAVLAAMGRLPHAVLDDVLIVGEIGLNGVVQPVHGVLPMVAEAKERGIRRCIVPRANRKEAALVSGMLVCGVENIGEVMRLLEDASWEKYAAEEYNIEETQPAVLPDFSEIHGQRLMKRACEVAVTGMHNLLFVGPPGAGKTMVASRIPSILPPLAEAERMELSKIYSVKGMLSGENGLLTQRPFRAPHHTVSVQGLTAAEESRNRGRSHWHIRACCFWMNFRNSPGRRLRRCASRWKRGRFIWCVLAEVMSIRQILCWWRR